MDPRPFRVLLVVAGSVYAVWYFLVELLLPGAFNPATSRFLVVGYFAGLLGLSYRSDAVRRHLEALYAVGAFLLTAHYAYLVHGNGFGNDWLLGSYITLLAVGATLERLDIVIAYTGAVATLLVAAAVATPTHSVWIPGLATVLVLLNVMALLRRRAKREHERATRLEGERRVAAGAERSKRLFLANLSHELRTPLNTILGFSQLAAEPDLEPRERSDFARRIATQGKSLLRLFEELVELAQSEELKLSVQDETISLVELLSDLRAKLADECERKGLTLEFVVDPEVPRTVVADPRHLRRIVERVLYNAVKFTARGRIAVHVAWSLASEGTRGDLCVTIRDSGVGVPPNEAARIFDVLSQGNEELNRPFGGMGIGLSLSREIARRLGGDVTLAASTPGAGSTFVVRLPVKLS